MPGDIQRIEKDQLACWRICHDDAEVIVSEQGAQVLSYRQGDATPIIWLSENANYEAGQPVRGGVPVCWPWFGDLKRNPDQVQDAYQGDHPAPAHGLVRSIDWTLVRQDCDADSASLTLTCNEGHALPGWPHPVHLSLHIRLDSKGLHLSLTSHNLGDAPVALSQALHSYFAVSDIRQVAVEGLDGCPYIETMDNWQRRLQQADLTFEGETDRIYLDIPSTLSIRDVGFKRRIRLDTQGSRAAVLWNPWIDKAGRLSQFADDAWQRMLCIETANVMDDLVILKPHASHTLSVSIYTEQL